MKLLRLWWDWVGPNNGLVGGMLFGLHVSVGFAMIIYLLT